MLTYCMFTWSVTYIFYSIEDHIRNESLRKTGLLYCDYLNDADDKSNVDCIYCFAATKQCVF